MGIILADVESLREADLESYQLMNKRFHDIVIEAAHNPAIKAALSRNEHLLLPLPAPWHLIKRICSVKQGDSSLHINNITMFTMRL